MNRPIRFWLAAVGVLAASHLVSTRAQAAPKDAAATKLADDAINSDYLATKFADAEKKLRKAIALCGTTACETPLRARLHRDLGVVLIAGLNKTDEGKAEFAEALKTDSGITLQKDFASPEIEKAWGAAKGSDGNDATPSAGSPDDSPVPPPATSAQSVGDIAHTPASEQATLTPVPVYVELPAGMVAARVVVRYRSFGSSDWKTIDARKVSKGYGVEIPCADVGSATGDLSYYVQALDAAGEPIGASGTRAQPFKVPIKNQLDAEPPHLPGRPPSARCADSADCPPGFPGCAKKRQGGKEAGLGCDSDAECADGLSCRNGTCDVSADAPMQSCEMDSDCEGGGRCVDHWCEAKRAGVKRNWFSFGVQGDLTLVPDVHNVCSPENAKGSITCLARDGHEYVGTPSEHPEDGGNAIKGGFSASTMRLLIGYDRLFGANWMAGVRLGYAFPSAPMSSMPFHFEGRVVYWFGNQPFTRTAIRPFAGLIGGAAEIDTKVKVPIVETDSRAANTTVGDSWGLFTDENGGQTLTVWRRTRMGFFGATVGAMLPLGSTNSGIQLEAKVFVSFPDSGTTISPVLSYVVGF